MTDGPATTPLVSAEQLVRHYRQGRGAHVVRAVDGVSFEINPGETFGLVGESGSGKSTVARLVLCLERPDSGVVRFEGQQITEASGADLNRLRREMQVVFQDPVASLNRRKTVEQVVMAPLIVHRIGSARARRERVHELLDLVGLGSAVANRYPGNLSGGQCQRVGIARALALQPKLVVLDEAVSAVDVSIRAQILNLLQDLQRRFGLAYLFISHDLAIVRYMASRLAVMYRGRIVELGTRDELFRDPEHPYTHALLEAVPEPEPQLALERPEVLPMQDIDEAEGDLEGCRYRTRCPIGKDLERCSQNDPELAVTIGDHPVACHFPLSTQGETPSLSAGER